MKCSLGLKIVLFGLVLLANYVLLYVFELVPKFSLSNSVRKQDGSRMLILNGSLAVDPDTTRKTQDAQVAIDGDDRPRNNDWEQLNRHDFFRRSMAYYFVEKSLLRLYFLTKSGWMIRRMERVKRVYDLQLIVDYAGQRYNLTSFNNVSKWTHDEREPYELASLNLELELVSEMRTRFGVNVSEGDMAISDQLRIRLFVVDKTKNLRTQHPLEVRIKSATQQTKRRGSMLCTYCYFFGEADNIDHYYMFLYWIELNKKFGYEKLAICNHSFPNTKEYADLFAKHKDFVVIYQLKTFPNMFNTKRAAGSSADREHKYYKSFNQVHWQFTVPLEVLMYNQCYMDHSDTYKYISINGADELIIPRTDTKFTTDKALIDAIATMDLANVTDKRSLSTLLGIESRCPSTLSSTNNEKPPIEKYVERLEDIVEAKDKVRRPQNFHFGMGHYLRDFSVELILNALDAYFKSERFNASQVTHVVSVHDTSYENYEYRFVLNGAYEVNYVRNLATIYRLLIGDVKRAKRDALAPHKNQYSRFLYFAGNLTWHLCGKSIYNTESVMAVNIHYPDKFEKAGLTTFGWEEGIGLDSHFRHQYSLRVSNVSFDELKIDLNYFYCYYRHVAKELLNIDVLD